ncbi:MAG TPA: HAD family hydrolase [Blastocatellia bacterium]|nr:HAD family hydrolase [Blastocatellia bacterium]
MIRAMVDGETPSNPQSAIRNPHSAVFIDRDGTLNEDIGYVSTPEGLILFPFAAEAVRLVNRAGLKTIVITNQSGIARGMYSEQTLNAIHSTMLEKLASEGAIVDAIYYCPHHPEIGGPLYRIDCNCRKPQTGMLEAARREHNIDLARSFVIGDKASDIDLARNAGARSALVLTGYGRETFEHPDRWPCEPDIVAENLLEALERILDTVWPES